jgi:hypothetical protein
MCIHPFPRSQGCPYWSNREIHKDPRKTSRNCNIIEGFHRQFTHSTMYPNPQRCRQTPAQAPGRRTFAVPPSQWDELCRRQISFSSRLLGHQDQNLTRTIVESSWIRQICSNPHIRQNLCTSEFWDLILELIGDHQDGNFPQIWEFFMIVPISCHESVWMRFSISDR